MFGDSDLGVIFADFGVQVIWTPEAGEPVTATGILDVYQDLFAHGSGPGKFQTIQYMLRVPYPALGGIPAPFDLITIAAGPNLPPDFTPGIYTVKELPEYKDPSIVDMILKGPA